jgi:hypothetical protein
VRVACLLPSSAPKPFTHYSLKSLKKLNKKHEYKTYEHAQTRSPVTLSTNNDLRKRHLKSVMHWFNSTTWYSLLKDVKNGKLQADYKELLRCLGSEQEARAAIIDNWSCALAFLFFIRFQEQEALSIPAPQINIFEITFHPVLATGRTYKLIGELQRCWVSEQEAMAAIDNWSCTLALNLLKTKLSRHDKKHYQSRHLQSTWRSTMKKLVLNHERHFLMGT